MAENTIATLSGMFKQQYGDTWLNLVPAENLFVKDIPFVRRSQQQGGTYHQPVRLTRSHGWTLNGTDGRFVPRSLAIAV